MIIPPPSATGFFLSAAKGMGVHYHEKSTLAIVIDSLKHYHPWTDSNRRQLRQAQQGVDAVINGKVKKKLPSS